MCKAKNDVIVHRAVEESIVPPHVLVHRPVAENLGDAVEITAIVPASPSEEFPHIGHRVIVRYGQIGTSEIIPTGSSEDSVAIAAEIARKARP